MQGILNLIRWKNLLMIALGQIIIKYALFEPFKATFGVATTLNTFQFCLLVLATVCIAAAGYIINDIYDVETDSINNPDSLVVGKTISEATAYNWFFGFTIVGVALGFYLSHAIGRSGFFAIFVIISALLYIYSSYLKGIVFAGNLVISGLVAASIIIVGLFDLMPAITSVNQDTQQTMFKIVLDYGWFALMINFIRELVKDIEDTDGDYKAGYQTLPILLGRDRATKITFGLALIPLGFIIYYMVTYLYMNLYAVSYFLAAVIAPLMYAIIKLFTAESKSQLRHISSVLKIVMLFGMLSLVLYPFILK